MKSFRINPEAFKWKGECELHNCKGWVHKIVVSKEEIVVCEKFFADWIKLKHILKEKKVNNGKN